MSVQKTLLSYMEVENSQLSPSFSLASNNSSDTSQYLSVDDLGTVLCVPS